MDCRTGAIWDERYLAYDFGDHPLNPVRLDLTIRLARELGVLDRLDITAPQPADEAQLLTVHDAAYLAAVRTAGDDPTYSGFGLGTSDDPVFPGMYDASALVAGGSAQAALRMWNGEVDHAVNIAGGLHHAMRGYASGFCIFNDVVLAIRTLLAAGAKKIAYVDIDVHHGDGVQAAFYDDPRVLTVSLHQDPRTLFPGTGLPSEVGTGAAEGRAVNVALPPGTDDVGWLRAFGAVVPSVVKAFKPGRAGHPVRLRHPPRGPAGQPRADRRRPAHRDRRIALAGTRDHRRQVGGVRRGRLRADPLRAPHLDAPAGRGDRPSRSPPTPAIPPGWTAHLRERGVRGDLPTAMGERPVPEVRPWEPGERGLARRGDRRDPARGLPAARPRPRRSP